MLVEPNTPIPERFGPFRVVSVLGRGGMGIVYRASHETTGEPIAVKTVTKHRAFDLAGLRREIYALQRVDHPGVVRIIASGVRDGIPWYAMPLLEGETLSSFSRAMRAPRDAHSEVRTTRAVGAASATQPVVSPLLERPDTHLTEMPAAAFGRLEEVLTIARRLCATLAFLHGEGIVHRDLTPANVFVVDGEHPRLLDFGLFREFAGDEGRESIDDPFGFTGGTIGYMSPEQARGELADARSDLYSLGVILYELITGTLPHPKSPLPPGLLCRDLPRPIDAMIMRLLAEDPAARFGHATELVPILGAHGAREAPWERDILPRGYLYRPKMVGRDAALAAIDDRLARALERQGGCVLIAGESGIGKTYLAMHAARAAASYGVQILASSCGAPGGAETPALHPFRAVLQAVADAVLATPELAPKLLGEHGRILATIEPRLASLPWVENSEPAPTGSGELVQRRLFVALTEMLEAYAEVWPAVLVLDDLQWADELTLRFLASLPNDWFDGKGLLVVATYRVDEDNVGIRMLESRPWALRVELSRLGDREVRALVRDMLALAEPPATWIAALTRASGGNPFFVAEYLRSAIGDGTLRRDNEGRWQFDAEILESGRASLPAPPRIDAIIARRLDALAPHARALLAALVVLERDANADLAAAVASLDEADALDAVRELVARQVVEARENTLNVLHDALRETAYRKLARDERRRLHRLAANLVESRGRGTPEFELLYASLARHFVEGGDARRAVHYLALAGERALATNASRDAIAHFSEALALADEADVDAVRRARFLRNLADAATALGDLKAAEGYLLAALPLLGEAKPGSVAWVAALARDLPAQIAHRVTAPSVERGGLERARLEEAARTFDRLAERAYFGYDATMMIAASLRAVNRGERAGLPMARGYAMLGITLGLSKLRSAAKRYFALAREAAAKTGDPFAGITESAYHTGETAWAEARPLVDEVIARATQTRDPRTLGFGETMLGHEQFYRGQFRKSAKTYRRIEERARREENQQLVAWGLYAGARALIPLGELDSASRMLQEAERLLASQEDAPSKLICAGLSATVELRRGNVAAARTAIERCEALIRTIPPTVFSIISGYLAAAEVRIELARASRDPGAMRDAKRAVSDLERFAFAIPLGRPAAARMRATLLLLQGKQRAAIAKLESAIAVATASAMRHEEALAHALLARILEGERATRHQESATAIFSELACVAPV
jgi:tetratricopeptide (TPR) repeat protein